MISAWVYVGLALLVVFSLGLFVGALVGSPGSRGHGGTVDLTRGAARGELDLDWTDPRLRDTFDAALAETRAQDPDRRPSFGV